MNKISKYELSDLFFMQKYLYVLNKGRKFVDEKDHFKAIQAEKQKREDLKELHKGAFTQLNCDAETIANQSKEIRIISQGFEVLDAKLKKKSREIELLTKQRDSAIAYIKQSPCDPDILPKQLKAWKYYEKMCKELVK